MTSPLAMASAGPKITPYSATQSGGGAALPPYLQQRRPTTAMSGAQPAGTPAPSYPGQTSQPTLTPKPTAVPGEVAPKSVQAPAPAAPQPAMTPAPTVATGATANATIPTPAPTPPPQAGGNNLNDIYGFFKSDLQNQTNQALANARTDAGARGVFYGTPLTGSEADINTQYLRGLGQLQAGMYGNEQQNELARLGLASSLGWQNSMNAPPSGTGSNFFSTLGGLFGPQNSPMGQQPTVSAPRPGPTGTPNNTGQQTGIDPITGLPIRL